MKKYAGMILLTAAAAAVSIYLPGRLFRQQDRQRTEQAACIREEPVQLTVRQQLTMGEKTELLENSEGVEVIRVTKGRRYEGTEVSGVVLEELNKLQLGDEEWKDPEILEESVSLLMDKNQMDHNMIIWYVQMCGDGYYLEAFLDDESGKLLNIYVGRESIPKNFEAENFASYLGGVLKRENTVVDQTASAFGEAEGYVSEDFEKKAEAFDSPLKKEVNKELEIELDGNIYIWYYWQQDAEYRLGLINSFFFEKPSAYYYQK